MQISKIFITALGALAIGSLVNFGGLGVRALDLEEYGAVYVDGDGGLVRNVHIKESRFESVEKLVVDVFGRHDAREGGIFDTGLEIVKKLTDDLLGGLFKRHEDEYAGGGVAVVTTVHDPIVYITLSSCSSSIVTVSLGSTSDVVIRAPSSSNIVVVESSTESKYTGIPSTDVAVVSSTTSGYKAHPSVETHIVPGTTTPGIYVPGQTLSTVTKKSTLVINTCPAGGCIVSIPVTTAIPISSGNVPAYSAPEVPGSTVTSIPPVITRTSTTATSNVPTTTASSFSTGFEQGTPTPSSIQGEAILAVSPLGSCLPVFIACALGALVYLI